MNRKEWTPEEDKILNEHYPGKYCIEVAKMLNRTTAQVYNRAYILQIKKSVEFKKQELQRQRDRLRESGKKNRFLPGSTPGNKGKKQTDFMSTEGILKSSKTRFSKNHIPANTNKEGDGAISVRTDKDGNKYLMIRIALGKWKQLTHYNWEQKYKHPVPKTHILRHKDGDRMNCSVENLECITRAENMIKNNSQEIIPDKRVARYIATKSRKVDKELQIALLKNPELLELKRQQLFLNRKIKQHGKPQHD